MSDIPWYPRKLNDDAVDHKCDNCDAPAIVNFQLMWIAWAVTDDGAYATDACVHKEYPMTYNEPWGNLHLCAKHALEEFGDRALRGYCMVGLNGKLETIREDIGLLHDMRSEIKRK